MLFMGTPLPLTVFVVMLQAAFTRTTGKYCGDRFHKPVLAQHDSHGYMTALPQPDTVETGLMNQHYLNQTDSITSTKSTALPQPNRQHYLNPIDSITSTKSMSLSVFPAIFRSFSIAGAGPMPMIVGSTPTTL